MNSEQFPIFARANFPLCFTNNVNSCQSKDLKGLTRPHLINQQHFFWYFSFIPSFQDIISSQCRLVIHRSIIINSKQHCSYLNKDSISTDSII
mmetsp:Transcript_11325/g.23854  ORF Transcript_11325/g.23854 Transcript_11325/m.23854 type:complete len:93 (-) Transcript_11325:11-289(-)